MFNSSTIGASTVYENPKHIIFTMNLETFALITHYNSNAAFTR